MCHQLFTWNRKKNLQRFAFKSDLNLWKNFNKKNLFYRETRAVYRTQTVHLHSDSILYNFIYEFIGFFFLFSMTLHSLPPVHIRTSQIMNYCNFHYHYWITFDWVNCRSRVFWCLTGLLNIGLNTEIKINVSVYYLVVI